MVGELHIVARVGLVDGEDLQHVLVVFLQKTFHPVCIPVSGRGADRVNSPVFRVEGWAVYTEQMMLDQGYGEGDPALRLTQLKFYLRAVANAILDHRMHCSRMSDGEALDFLMNQSFQSEGEAQLKIIRSKQSTVQLSTYFVGRMALYDLRREIQREQGPDFDLGRYHEAVLAHGSLPVKYLGELVRERLGSPR